MALYGWDASHYDGLLTTAILATARSEGITFFTHKIGEGLSDTEGTMDDTALAAARDAGIPFLGGYVVPRSLDSAAQVDYWWQLLNAGEPWWHDFPGWFNQVDLERWGYDNVSAAKGIDCAKRWRDKTGRQTILYASHGQYGDSLSGWDGPIWNADYTSRPVGGVAAMYPGDDWQPLHGTWRGGWAPYSGKTPAILQYTSSATIAGLTTCDANAFCGAEAEFRALITGGNDMALTDQQTANLLAAVDVIGAMQLGWDHTWDKKPIAFMTKLNDLGAKVTTLQAATAPTQDQVDAAILKAMQDPAVQKGIGDAIASHLKVS